MLEKTTDMVTVATDTATVATAAETAVTAGVTGVGAATEITVDGMTAAPVQAEVTLMTDTDAATRATDIVVDEEIEAVTTTAVEDVLGRVPLTVTGATSLVVSEKGLAIASVVVRSVKEAAVRRPLPQKLQKTIVTSVLSSFSRFPSVPRHAIFAPSSRPLAPLLKPRLSKIELPAAQRGKLNPLYTIDIADTVPVSDMLSSRTKSLFPRLWS